MILRAPTGTGSIHIFIRPALCPDLVPFWEGAGMGCTEFGSSQALVLFVLHHNLVWTFGLAS